jgi:hypothetical protein
MRQRLIVPIQGQEVNVGRPLPLLDEKAGNAATPGTGEAVP